MALQVIQPRQRGLSDLINAVGLYRMVQQGRQEEHMRGQREFQLGRLLGRDDLIESGAQRMGQGDWGITQIGDPFAQRKAYEQQQQVIGEHQRLMRDAGTIATEEARAKKFEMQALRAKGKKVQPKLKQWSRQMEGLEKMKKRVGERYEMGRGLPTGEDYAPNLKGRSYQEKRSNLFKDTMRLIKGKETGERNNIIFRAVETQRQLDDLYGRRRGENMLAKLYLSTGIGKGKGGKGKYVNLETGERTDVRGVVFNPKTQTFKSGWTWSGSENMQREVERLEGIIRENTTSSPEGWEADIKLKRLRGEIGANEVKLRKTFRSEEEYRFADVLKKKARKTVRKKPQKRKAKKQFGHLYQTKEELAAIK